MIDSSKKIIYLLSLSFVFFTFFVANTPVLAQTGSGDAIFIRVIANPEHYSAQRWYLEQGFTGAPQAREVDGYEAVVDGRTVYVNAGNVSNTGTFYTNIYHISYNQDPLPTTLSIFNRMLERWKFNTNLPSVGTCSISALYCQTDSDCPEDYSCGGAEANKCHLKESRDCWSDRECPEHLFCSSEKAITTRRTRTLGNLADVQKVFQDYIDIHGKLPDLSSGTYLQDISLSVWPSWQITLAQDFGSGFFPIDPINVIGSCPGANFNMQTCWNDINKTYAGGGVSLGTSGMNVPNNSYLYAYVRGTFYVVTGNSVEQMDLSMP